jgi:O-antigen/teichoic acid export membrane protein
MNSVYLPDPASVETMPPEPSLPTELPTHLTKKIIGGTSALGASVFMERGAGFLANILAARLGGAATFGAYSLAVTTANNISTYAAGGIGATAARFSGKYPFGTAGYKTLARALMIVSLASAALASSALWLGAAPIAHLLHKDSLTGLLRWAALSSAGIILLECARGFFVGQRRHAALMLLSLIVGAGMISLIPVAAARHSPVHMIVSQGIITTSAVVVCLLLARALRLQDHTSLLASPLPPMLREVWTFGFIQLAGLIGCNLAGWWLTTLVARSDTALIQMSFFAIASQLRNMVALPPALLTESSYAMMADREGEMSRTPSHVMALCTFASTFASLLLASIGIVLVPWGLRIVYGSTYATASVATAVALAVAVVHMGNAPASARLTVVSIRSAGVINTVWAVFVAVAASVFALHQCSAGRAMAIYLAAHLLASTLVLVVLAWKDHMPRGMAPVFFFACGTVIALAALSVVRARRPEHSLAVTGAMAALSVVSLTMLFFIGRRNHWLPKSAAVRRMLRSAPSFVSGMFRPARESRSDDVQ